MSVSGNGGTNFLVDIPALFLLNGELFQPEVYESYPGAAQIMQEMQMDPAKCIFLRNFGRHAEVFLVDLETGEWKLVIRRIVCGYCNFTCEDITQHIPTRCGQCRLLGYCNSQCQSDDWPRHKKHCVGLIRCGKMNHTSAI